MSKLYTNSITLKGFLGKDASFRTTNQNRSLVLSLATRSSYKNKQNGEFVSRTDWHRIVAFGQLAESSKGLVKGAYVQVEGQLVTREYNSDQGTRRITEVRARSIESFERPKEAENLDEKQKVPG